MSLETDKKSSFAEKINHPSKRLLAEVRAVRKGVEFFFENVNEIISRDEEEEKIEIKNFLWMKQSQKHHLK